MRKAHLKKEIKEKVCFSLNPQVMRTLRSQAPDGNVSKFLETFLRQHLKEGEKPLTIEARLEQLEVRTEALERDLNYVKTRNCR